MVRLLRPAELRRLPEAELLHYVNELAGDAPELVEMGRRQLAGCRCAKRRAQLRSAIATLEQVPALGGDDLGAFPWAWFFGKTVLQGAVRLTLSAMVVYTGWHARDTVVTAVKTIHTAAPVFIWSGAALGIVFLLSKMDTPFKGGPTSRAGSGGGATATAGSIRGRNYIEDDYE